MILYLCIVIIAFLIFLWFFTSNKSHDSNDGTSDGSNPLTNKILLTVYATIVLLVLSSFSFTNSVVSAENDNKDNEVDAVAEAQKSKTVSKLFDTGEHILTIYCGNLGTDEFVSTEDMETCSVQTPHFDGYEVINVDVSVTTVANKVYTTYKNIVPVSCKQGQNGTYDIVGTPVDDVKF